MNMRVIVIIILITAKDAWSWSMTIEPNNTRVRPGGSLDVMCRADAALSGCGFQVGDQGYYEYSQGAKSKVTVQKRNNQTDGRKVYTAQYHGAGLEKGECGLKLSQLTEHGANYYVGCRARTADGGWKYKYTSFVVHSGDTLTLKMSPKQAIVHPGKPISFVCQSDKPLRMCSYDLASQEDTFVASNRSANVQWGENYRYHGQGLQHGQCGITIAKAVDRDSGIVWCGADSRVDDISQRSAMLIVIKGPSRPPFLFLSKTAYMAGDTLEATCTVWSTRPRANITWYLGNKVVRKDSDDDSSLTDWRWPWDVQSITQILKVAVDVADDGKDLRCEVSHLALKTPIESKAPIAVGPKKASSATPSTPNTSTPPKNDGVASVAGVSTATVSASDANCGRRKMALQITNHISKGEEADIGQYPWHAGVYRVQANGSHTLDCSGTLITPRIVISVAHCFWNEAIGRKVNSTYAIGVGKIERSWDSPDDTSAQRVGVTQVHLHEKYRGRKRNHQHDIALVQLATPVKLGDDVNVACVDWEDKLETVQLVAGSLGTVTGWGVTEDGVRSDTLKFVQLPYVDDAHCYDLLPEDLQQMVTTDKFCAGFTNRSTSVCPGDSGGGLVYYDRSTQRFTLRGVVSVAFRPADNKELCYAQQVTGFTLISAYRNWIRQLQTANKIS